jgi:hypothetical protein
MITGRFFREEFMIAKKLSVIVFLLPSLGFGQNMSHQPWMEGGHVIVHDTPVASPRSLLDLTTQARLVVDGTIIGSLPPINLTPNQRPGVPAVETHSIVSINRVIFGEVPNRAATILLIQGGGQLAKWNIEVDGDPLVRAGERYLLFLTPDDRKEVPAESGMSRYSVLGIWSGKARIQNGVIKFPESAAKELHQFDGNGVDAFVQRVEQTIAHPYTDASLPIHLAPQSR